MPHAKLFFGSARLLAIVAALAASVAVAGASLSVDPATIADHAAAIAMQPDGIIRLALYVAALAIGALVLFVLLWMRYMVRITVALERMAGRPCLLNKDGQSVLSPLNA